VHPGHKLTDPEEEKGGGEEEEEEELLSGPSKLHCMNKICGILK
jgi:hypothetical protein